VTFLNLSAQTLFGVSERQTLGRKIGDVIVPPGDVERLCHRAIERGETLGFRELEIRVAGRELRVDCRASRFDDHSGILLEFIDTSRDRGIRREAELFEQQKISRRIVRQLAHEVKNPLGGMRGAAQLLERKLPSDELKRYTTIIIEEADRLAALVDSALRPASERKPEELNLHRVTEHVAELLRAESPAGVELVRDYDPSLPPVYVDRGQLIQALLNIARNALQAVGETGRIVLRTRVLANFTIGQVQHRLVGSLEVEDDGPGIPEDLQANVFYPLVTSKRTGAGIGLTIAQELVAGNDGLIEFDSRPGKTVFRIRMPVRDTNSLRQEL
jgi:two-component system nitrogen regulation sensor histidine kinase GlnL